MATVNGMTSCGPKRGHRSSHNDFHHNVFPDLVTPIIPLIPLTFHDVTTMTHHEENSGSLLQNILAEYASAATEDGKKVKPIMFIVTNHFLQHSDNIQRET